jgi:hypothetical protein
MSVFLQPIYTQTVGVGGASTITFNNIPQTFTDLVIKYSSRTTAAATDVDIYMQLNGDTGNNYSATRLYGQGSSVGTDRQLNSNIIRIAGTVGTSATANTFASGETYIANYAGSNYKSVIVDDVEESNTATGFYMFLTAGLWRSTSAITSMLLSSGSGSFVQYSTFSLYGVLRQGI